MTRTSKLFPLGLPLSCPCGAELRLHLREGTLHVACTLYPSQCHFAKSLFSEWLPELIGSQIKLARMRGRSIAAHLRKIAVKIDEQLKSEEERDAL